MTRGGIRDNYITYVDVKTLNIQIGDFFTALKWIKLKVSHAQLPQAVWSGNETKCKEWDAS